MSDWEEWRANYEEMDFAAQKEFYAPMKDYPDRVFFKPLDIALWNMFMKYKEKSFRVLEFGGATGVLAKEVLRDAENIICWYNFEIRENCKTNNVCLDERYHIVIPDHFLWDGRKIALNNWEVFVAADSLEHISVEHLEKLLDVIANIPHLFIRIPLPEVTTDWAGYIGSHILQLRMHDFIKLIEEKGWKLVYRATSILHFARDI